MITRESRKKMGWRKGKVFTGYYKKCLVCHKQFYTVPTSSKQKTCSQNCNSLNKRILPTKDKCKQCGKDISFPKYKPKVYCSRSCGSRSRWHNSENFKTSRFAKNELRTMANKCFKCQYKNIPEILQIHHIDRNRKNNKRENVILLCPNCHEEEHYQNKDGRYKNNLGLYH